MTDNFPTKNDEVELIEILKDIWSGRLKIILITIITILVGVGYIYIKPTLFKNSLIIRSIDKEKFTKLNSAYEIFNVIKTESGETKELTILKKFIDHLMDYNELSITLKNNEIIKKDITKLFITSKLNDNEYILDFIWHDTEEAKNILNQTLNLTSNNFNKLLFQELIDLWEIEKTKILNKDLKKVNFLLEQSLIAKELNLQNNNLNNNINVFLDKDKDTDYEVIVKDVYLRGYKAIDKEINLIKNRKYENFINIEKNIENINDINLSLVNYNILKIDTKSTKNSKLILLISLIMGLLVGVCYALIHAAFQKSKN
jgi:LPS O-antigen subunit length determinant protein (WzzB/FepE family)